jgi:eukaryotic-like serine/threonine-protein kinase
MVASSAPRYADAHLGPSHQPALTLRALLDSRRAERRTFTLEEAIATVVPLCMDLQELHARGVRLYVHASCIAPGPDGLARLSPERSFMPTDLRDRVCLAPELLQTLEPGNARASVFAIGALLYECVTGWPIGPAMRRPRDFNPDLPEALEGLIAKALVSDPAHRPDDLGALASALHHIAPMKNIPPPEVDEGRLDHGADFEVDVRLSMLPPSELAREVMYSPPGPPSGPLSSPQVMDRAGHVVQPAVARRAHTPNVTERLAELKARLESDTRPRYVVNKDKMDHGPFSAVELLQQITTNSFTGDHILRDELSGQSHAISEWAEFAPFAEQVALKREVIAEKKAVARVESREKKAGVAKSILGVFLVLAIGAGAALWFFEVRGSRKDEVEVADDSTLDLSLDGGIKGQKRKTAGGGGAGGKGGPGGMSYEAAVGSNIQQIDMNGHVTGPDLTDLQLSGPLRNATFLNSCGAPDSMHVTVKVAIKMGRAVGVSVYSSPPNAGVASCVDRAVRNLAWPVNAKMDSFVTTY